MKAISKEASNMFPHIARPLETAELHREYIILKATPPQLYAWYLYHNQVASGTV